MTNLSTWFPTNEQKRFIRNFGEKVLNNEAALFIGAGVSRSAGFVDWKGLLSDIAEDLNLDISKEHDLLALAQYHVNSHTVRGEINQQLIDAFIGDVNLTPVHDIISRLPIDTVWTTNYDRLIEKSYESAGRNVEVKLTIENLAQARKGRDVTVYKMHGCVSQPHDAVLTKQDYEVYDVKRRLFTDSLKGDFVEKTLLFIGFSFTDPNVERILSKVREQLGQNQRTHYWITRRPSTINDQNNTSSEEIEYNRIKSELQSEDLKRYGIQTVWVDDFSHIPVLLRALESYVMKDGVFISGAAFDPEPLGWEKLNELSRALGKKIIMHRFNLVSGFGVGIAEQVILGAFHAVYENTNIQPADRVRIRPFPGNTPDALRAEAYRKHRRDLISQAGAVVVLAGNKIGQSQTVITSNGVEEEVDIALELNKPVIPIGMSGHVAKRIWSDAIINPNKYLPGIDGQNELSTLGVESASVEDLVNAVISILEKTRNCASTKII